MKSRNQLKLNTSLVIILFLLVGSNGQMCEVKDVCECVYEDGSGYNLKELTGTPIEIIPNDNNLRILFSPCKNVNLTGNYSTNECQFGYTLCLIQLDVGHAHLLGSTQNTTFDMHDNQMFLKFGNSQNVSTVELQCTPYGKNSVLYAPQDTKLGNLSLTLFSKVSCPKQVEVIETHGFFYTFFLIAFIILFSYLVVGVLYNYFFVGARGFELLPNYDFWTRLWNSIKLGFIFVKNGFRVLPTEDSYDAI